MNEKPYTLENIPVRTRCITMSKKKYDHESQRYLADQPPSPWLTDVRYNRDHLAAMILNIAREAIRCNRDRTTHYLLRTTQPFTMFAPAGLGCDALLPVAREVIIFEVQYRLTAGKVQVAIHSDPIDIDVVCGFTDFDDLWPKLYALEHELLQPLVKNQTREELLLMMEKEPHSFDDYLGCVVHIANYLEVVCGDTEISNYCVTATHPVTAARARKEIMAASKRPRGYSGM